MYFDLRNITQFYICSEICLKPKLRLKICRQMSCVFSNGAKTFQITVILITVIALLLCTVGCVTFFKTLSYQGILKATVSGVLEDLRFKISEGSDQN